MEEIGLSMHLSAFLSFSELPVLVNAQRLRKQTRAHVPSLPTPDSLRKRRSCEVVFFLLTILNFSRVKLGEFPSKITDYRALLEVCVPISVPCCEAG